MGIRFRRSIKLAPGVRMNFSGSGVSWTLGPRGASIGIGRRGTYLNSGIPGTGLYARERVGQPDTTSQSHTSSFASVPIKIGVTDDGTVYFQDSDGNPLQEHLVTAAKKQQGDAIRNLIQQKCDEINAQIEALGEIHFYTPDPVEKPGYVPQEFAEPVPQRPNPTKLGLMGALLRSRRERIEKENSEKISQFQKALSSWHAAKLAFDATEQSRKNVIEKGIYEDVEVMKTFLEEVLQDIVWPRETTLSTEILDGGREVFVDVDLPEIEDLPRQIASVPQRGYKLSVKDMSAGQVQRLYMRHVHGVGFRLIGEVFSALPKAQLVVLSAYSQRPNRSTGNVEDEYLYSVRVDRSAWARINFANLREIDVVEALAQFEIRRSMTKTGVFKPVEPFSPTGEMGSVSNYS
jgi:hypothetical protein